jgi:hypothetical protein
VYLPACPSKYITVQFTWQEYNTITFAFQAECSCKAGPCPRCGEPPTNEDTPLPTTGEFQTQKGCFTAMQCPKFKCQVDYTMEPMHALLKWTKQNGEKCNWKIGGTETYFYTPPNPITDDEGDRMMNWLVRKLEHDLSPLPC